MKTISALLLCFACAPLYPQTAPAPAATESSCQKFVQDFYDWYLPRARTAKGTPDDLVLKEKPTFLSRELFKALKEDSDAQAKDKSGDIVGLDFDPFLNSQDDSFQKCAAGNAVIQGTSCRVDVSCNFPKQKAESPVTPELTFTGGHWVFVNFHYSVDGKAYDLLKMLKDLREERQKPQPK